MNFKFDCTALLMLYYERLLAVCGPPSMEGVRQGRRCVWGGASATGRCGIAWAWAWVSTTVCCGESGWEGGGGIG
eukprot:365643-Chlamydomonas_euryale.AAC.5